MYEHITSYVAYFFLKDTFFIYLCECGCTCGCWHPQRPEVFDFPRAGVTGCCESLSVGIENQTGPLEEQYVFLITELSL